MTKAIEVSERALIGRINRKLAHEEQLLRKYRPGQQTAYGGPADGEYYVIYTRSNSLVNEFRDLEDYARQLGVLGAGEKMLVL